jgi:hypothetical protein
MRPAGGAPATGRLRSTDNSMGQEMLGSAGLLADLDHGRNACAPEGQSRREGDVAERDQPDLEARPLQVHEEIGVASIKWAWLLRTSLTVKRILAADWRRHARAE